ncbi:MAG: helix-turn-helix domain-containing protein [Chloroflexi bacterium]|nr:helix-turn-helix domain-containing protein [Chloroflexota bacterium]
MNPSLFTEDPVLTIPQVAKYLQLSRSKVYYLASRKQLPHLKLGKSIRVRMSDLQKWLAQQIEEPTAN